MDDIIDEEKYIKFTKDIEVIKDNNNDVDVKNDESQFNTNLNVGINNNQKNKEENKMSGGENQEKINRKRGD